MNLDEIKELIAVMRRNKIKEIDLERGDVKVRIVSNDPAQRSSKAAPEVLAVPQVAQPYYMPPPAGVARPTVPSGEEAALAQDPPASPKAEKPKAPEPAEPAGIEIKSPMVGTFYRAPAPDAPSYVEVGATVGPDTVLCIVEAMKLMNEIKAEASGKVLKVLVENGQPVEFNQPLFLLEAP